MTTNSTKRALKAWPAGHKLVDIEKLLAPVRGIMNRAGTWKQRDPLPPLAYVGYDIGQEDRHVRHCADFSRRGVARAEDQNFSVLDMVLDLVFMLGVEQGRRVERERNSAWVLVLRSTVNQMPAGEDRAYAEQALLYISGDFQAARKAVVSR